MREVPGASPAGIALTALSIAMVLWLVRQKHRTGEALGSRALVVDAQQTFSCWYLSLITLAGLVLSAALGWWWADPVAALGISALLVREGVEALRGEGPTDDAAEQVANAVRRYSARGPR